MTMNYDRFEGRIMKRSSINLDGVVYATRRENNFIIIIVMLCLVDLLFSFLVRVVGLTKFASYHIMLSIIFITILFISTRRAGVGIGFKFLFYGKYSNLLFRELSVEEIPFNKIQYLDVKKIGPFISVKMSFINKEGKLKQGSFSYLTFSAGRYKKRYNAAAMLIYDRLKELQKVLDKGDF